MSQSSLFLLVISLWGLFLVQPLLRSMHYAEPVIKLVLALVAGLGISLAGFINITFPSAVTVLAVILIPVFILTPVILNLLVKHGRYTLAKQLTTLLYWTESGQNVIKQFLARVALQRDDVEGALEHLAPDDPLMIRAYALRQDWDKVLSLPFADSLEYHFVRIEALIAKGQIFEAEQSLHQLRQLWEQKQTPEGYQMLQLSETRFEAERGQVEQVQKKVQTSLNRVPLHIAFGLLARAAEVAHYRESATNLYTQAYVAAPESQRQGYAAKLQAMGQALPEIHKAKTPYGTYALCALIVSAFFIQLWLENRYDQSIPRAMAAFLLNFEVPESDARWRFLSYAFLHGGLAHIAFNAWALLDLGKLYEVRRNWANMLTAFIVGAVMGAYFTLVVQSQQQIVLVGASGGICGIASALLADSLRGGSVQDRYLTQSLLQWVVFISIFGLVIPNVSFWGHTGGIIGGLLWGFIRQGLPQGKRIDWFIGGISIGLISYTLLSVVNYFFTYR